MKLFLGAGKTDVVASLTDGLMMKVFDLTSTPLHMINAWNRYHTLTDIYHTLFDIKLYLTANNHVVLFWIDKLMMKVFDLSFPPPTTHLSEF